MVISDMLYNFQNYNLNTLSRTGVGLSDTCHSYNKRCENCLSVDDQ